MNEKWRDLVVGLEGDERVIFPHMLDDNRDLYDKIVGRAFLVQSNTDPDRGLDLIWDRELGTDWCPLEDVEVISSVFVVRLRLPWSDMQAEFLCSGSDLEQHEGDLEIIDTVVRVVDKETNSIIPMIDKLKFESNREDYEVHDVVYLVRWKYPKEPRASLISSIKDRIHTVLAE